jgi:hypothetical protein
MAGQDAFHAACFTCKTCHKRIEETVFAKASHGIYYMDCHNDRVARTRRHAERRQAKSRSQRTKTASGSREPAPRTPVRRYGTHYMAIHSWVCSAVVQRSTTFQLRASASAALVLCIKHHFTTRRPWCGGRHLFFLDIATFNSTGTTRCGSRPGSP